MDQARAAGAKLSISVAGWSINEYLKGGKGNFNDLDGTAYIVSQDAGSHLTQLKAPGDGDERHRKALFRECPSTYP